jgi:hypothetical protein
MQLLGTTLIRQCACATLDLLVKRGERFSDPKRGYSLLHLAVSVGNIDVAKRLLGNIRRLMSILLSSMEIHSGNLPCTTPSEMVTGKLLTSSYEMVLTRSKGSRLTTSWAVQSLHWSDGLCLASWETSTGHAYVVPDRPIFTCVLGLDDVNILRRKSSGKGYMYNPMIQIGNNLCF